MSKNQQKPQKRGFLEYLAVKCEISPDSLAGEARIELRGKHRLFVYGCRRIITYSPTLIALALKGDELSIKGERLICTSYHGGAVSIEGVIFSLSFCGGKA